MDERKTAPFELEIIPARVVTNHPVFGERVVEHAYANVLYVSAAIKTRTGKVEICQLPNATDVAHKYPHTDDLGPTRVEEIRQRLCQMTGRNIQWIEHAVPMELVPAPEIDDLDESGDIEDLDAAVDA